MFKLYLFLIHNSLICVMLWTEAVKAYMSLGCPYI